MSVVQVSVQIEAPPEQVWKVVADPRNLPLWDRHVVGVIGVPPEGLKPGTRYVTEVRLMGITARSASEVVKLEPPRHSVVTVKGLVDATVETWLDPVDGDGTVLRHRVEYRFIGGPLGRLAARAIQMLGAAVLLKRGTEAQRRQVEERVHQDGD